MALRWAIAERLAAPGRRALLPTLRARLDLAPGLELLDVGGGTGWVAEQLAPGRATVVEPHAGKRAHGERTHPGVRFVDAKGERLPFPDARFDRALFLLSLHHVSDALAALREARRVLRDRGRVVVGEFDPRARLPRWVHVVHGKLGSPAHLLPAEELARILAAAGFGAARVDPVRRGYVASASVGSLPRT